MQTILNFIIKHNHWFLFLLLEGISFVLIISFNSYQSAVMFTSANSVTGNIYSAISDVSGYFGLKDENMKLLDQNSDLMNEVESLKAELRCYEEKEALTHVPHTGKKKENLQYYTARVVNNSLNKVNNYITIDKGHEDGIEQEMGVFNEKGIVGIVYQTSEHFSIVIPLLNSKSKISCRIKDTNSFCSLQWDGGDVMHSYLVDLPRYTIFDKGDTVITSGFSSIFPADIPVGRIENLEDSEDGLFYRAKVGLFVDFSTLDNLYIVGNSNKDEQSKLEKSISKE